MYPSPRTYAITLAGFTDTVSGYTMTGTLTFAATFNSGAGGMTLADCTLSFDSALTGGTISRIIGNATCASYTSMASFSGTVTCDGTAFSLADLQ